MLDALKARIKQLSETIEQSAANHNFLAGALQEVKAMHDMYVKVHGGISEGVKIAEAVMPAGSEALQVIEDVAAIAEAI